MGYMKHNAIVVIGYGKEDIESVFNEAKEVFGDLVSPVVDSVINGYCSFFVAPDGSKEGWEDSNRFDEKRVGFFKWLESHNPNYCDAVDIRFGGDDDYEEVVQSTAHNL